MDFVAIDFETANEKRNSPCSLGITVVSNGQIVEERYWLIRPPEFRFSPMNIRVHGIQPEEVEHEPTFYQIWPEVKPYLEHRFVIAHNASFDISVLRNTLDTYGITYPSFTYGCTVQMAKNFFPYLENAKLHTVSHHLGHRFNHHHAAADATACANILLKIADELELDDIDEIMSVIAIDLGNLNADGYNPPKGKKGSITSRREHLPGPLTPNEPGLTEDYFHDKFVAFTGSLGRMTRPQAVRKVQELGATYTSSVTKKTNLLIVGGKDPDTLSPHQMSTKLRRAKDLISQGQKIEIIKDQDIFF